MRRYIDEYLTKDAFDYMKDVIIKSYKENYGVYNLVSKDVQDKLYVFTDERETNWLHMVISAIVNNQPITNRFTQEVFNE